MRLSVIRKNIKFIPDSKRVVTRYFMNGEERTQQMVMRIMTLDEKQVSETLEQTLREFARRHRNNGLDRPRHRTRKHLLRKYRARALGKACPDRRDRMQMAWGVDNVVRKIERFVRRRMRYGW